MRHVIFSLIVWAKSQDSVHKPQFVKRKESRSGSNRDPSAYQPSALLLGHTASRHGYGSSSVFMQSMEWSFRKVPQWSVKRMRVYGYGSSFVFALRVVKGVQLWTWLALVGFVRRVWGSSKGFVTFVGFFFYAMRSLVPVEHFRNISGHLFTRLVCGSFQWRHGLLFTVCIVWDDKDKVTGFNRSQLDPLKMMKYRVSKALTVSIVTAFTRHQLSVDSFFSLLSMKCDIIIQKCSYLKVSWGKILHAKSRTQCFSNEEFFRRFVSRSDTPKFRK